MKKRESAFFEGWYFKHQSKSGTVCLIPAVHRQVGKPQQASLQVIWDDGAHLFEFPAKSVDIDRKQLLLRIGDSTFSKTGVFVNARDNNCEIHGEISFGPLTPPKSDVMGPFRFLPFLQCSHGVISLCHSINGALTINGRHFDMNGGTGYIEKDAGISFPEWYLWTQCCVFDVSGVSVMLSVADIPFLGKNFIGCICCILYNNNEYRLATYKSAKVRFCSETAAEITQGNYRFRTELMAARPHILMAPAGGEMIRKIEESAACTVRYRFYEKDRLIFDLTSPFAGFEYVQTGN